MKRMYLTEYVTTEELTNIREIFTAKDIALSAMKPEVFPDKTNPDILQAFYHAALSKYTEATNAEKRWWGSVNERFTLPI
jgi:hypothetical protein